MTLGEIKDGVVVVMVVVVVVVVVVEFVMDVVATFVIASKIPPSAKKPTPTEYKMISGRLYHFCSGVDGAVVVAVDNAVDDENVVFSGKSVGFAVVGISRGLLEK